MMKMMRKNPLHAMRIIDNLQLHSSIFTGSVDPPRNKALWAAEILSHVDHVFPGQEMLWLAAATVPFDGYLVPGKKEVPAVYSVIGEGLKVNHTGCGADGSSPMRFGKRLGTCLHLQL